MNVIRLALSGVPRPTLINDGTVNVEMLTGNVVFSEIATDVTTFSAALTKFKNANDAYEEQKQHLAYLHSKLEDEQRAYEDAYRTLAAACEKVTLDPTKLESGGWAVRKTPAPVGPLPAPANLRSKLGAFPGTTDLECDPVHGAVSYVAECATTATGPFTRVYEGTRTKCTVGDMESGALYYFRMRALGAAGPSPWSDITEKRAA